jgi:hypothetical protein
MFCIGAVKAILSTSNRFTMKQPYINPPGKDWIKAVMFIALLLLVHLARAQQGGQGNTTIFGGGQMTFFANYNFNTGGSGAQPGVILTERATGNFGILNFSGANLVATNASDAGYVDGYVRKYGTGQFIFPVGDNAHLGQFAASADGTMGAYFFANPTTAVTTNLFTGGNYPALPVGGPFPTTTMSAQLTAVSTVEYWDIDGANPTPITLTWDATSDLANLLTNGALPYLTIAGWNGTQWVKIPSVFDEESILGGFSDITAGSITTTAPIVPNTYTAYTLASAAGPDLSPSIAFLPATIVGTTNVSIVLNVYEFNNLATSGLVTVRILKDPLYALVFNSIATVVAGQPVNNSTWIFDPVSDPTYYVLTTSQVIPASGSLGAGFTTTFTPGASKGSTVISTFIQAGSGGEIDDTNNADDDTLIYKPAL